MLNFLLKLYDKKHENQSQAERRRGYGQLCSVYGIFLNLLLFAGKYFAGLISGSVAVMADAFNNLSDAGSSVITLLGFAIAGKKPDPHHPFGHGRAEYLAGLALSVMIALMGFELLKSSVGKIIAPESIIFSALSAGILLCSILVKLYMAHYNRRIGKKIGSAAMEATGMDALSDAAATAVVLLSMGVSHFFALNIDGWAGLVVSGFILLAAYNAAKDTISPLLGQAPEAELVKDIEETVMAYPEVIGIHDLMVHDYGPGRRFVSLHAEVNGSSDMFQVHDAIDSAEMELREKFSLLATIHMDPIEADSSEVMQLKSAVQNKLREHFPSVSIHDFRMVPGPSHTNLIFDALLPADFELEDSEAAEEIRRIVSESFEHHYAVVEIDRSYV